MKAWHQGKVASPNWQLLHRLRVKLSKFGSSRIFLVAVRRSNNCFASALSSRSFFFFFFNDTATTEIYTLSLHDALPIFTSLTHWVNLSPSKSPPAKDPGRIRQPWSNEYAFCAMRVSISVGSRFLSGSSL